MHRYQSVRPGSRPISSPLQFPDREAQGLAHAPYLPVQPLGQDDAEHVLGDPPRSCRARDLAQDFHAACKGGEKFIGHRAVNRHHVFLLVAVLGTQQLIDDVAVVGQQDQPLGELVQPPDREDSRPVRHEVDDVVPHPPICRALDARWLVQRNVNVVHLVADGASVDFDHVRRADRRAKRGKGTIDRDPPGADPGIRLAPRAQAAFA
jgi:hypothetical protein